MNPAYWIRLGFIVVKVGTSFKRKFRKKLEFRGGILRNYNKINVLMYLFG